MKIKRISTIRKKTQNRLENVRFMRAVRQAKERQSLRTEHAVLHNLIYQQISPALRERVINRGNEVNKLLLRNLS